MRDRCREQQIPKSGEIIEKLDPIIQATKLLQTKKTEEHISTIVEMCYKLRSVPCSSFHFWNLTICLFPKILSASQIIKILNLYTAGDEEVISNTFMKKITKHLNDNRKERKLLFSCPVLNKWTRVLNCAVSFLDNSFIRFSTDGHKV